MMDYMIENLEYHPDLSGSPIPLPKRYKQKIRQVVKWTKYINKTYGADTDWTTLTQDDFTWYRENAPRMESNKGTSTTPTS